MRHVHRKVNSYITHTVCGNKRLYELLAFLSIPVFISLTVHIMCRTCGALCIIPVGKNSPLIEWECEGGEVSPRHSTALIHSTLYDRLIPTIAQSNTILTSTMNSCYCTTLHAKLATAQCYILLVMLSNCYCSYLVIYYHKMLHLIHNSSCRVCSVKLYGMLQRSLLLLIVDEIYDFLLVLWWWAMHE